MSTLLGAVLRVTGPGLNARHRRGTAAHDVATIKAESDDRPGQTQRLEPEGEQGGCHDMRRAAMRRFRARLGPEPGARGQAGSASLADMPGRRPPRRRHPQTASDVILVPWSGGQSRYPDTLGGLPDPAVKLKELDGGRRRHERDAPTAFSG